MYLPALQLVCPSNSLAQRKCVCFCSVFSVVIVCFNKVVNRAFILLQKQNPYSFHTPTYPFRCVQYRPASLGKDLTHPSIWGRNPRLEPIQNLHTISKPHIFSFPQSNLNYGGEPLPRSKIILWGESP